MNALKLFLRPLVISLVLGVLITIFMWLTLPLVSIIDHPTTEQFWLILIAMTSITGLLGAVQGFAAVLNAKYMIKS